MASITSLGIGSGVLNSDLLEKLVKIEREPTEKRLNLRQEKVETFISEFGKLQSAITALRLPARTLGNPDAMRIFSATSSGSAVAAQVDGKKAQAGQYAIDVTDLAQSHSVATGTFADKEITSVGTGRLTIKVGSVTKNIDITSSNSTLSGIASEINKAKIGVSASVVDTGSGFRLVMSSEKTGASNAIQISVLDDDANSLDNNGLSRLAFNPSASNLTETVEAKDATFTVNGVSVSRATNTISDVIEGVTLNLTAKTSGSPVTLKVAQDTAGVADRVEEFVNKYNELQSLVAELTKFDPASKEGGVFLGDAAVRTINNQLKSTLSQLIPGLENASVRTLSEAGITTNAQTGQLQLDRQRFISKLESSPNDMVALFAEQGRTSDSQVEFLTSSINTKAGTYAVNVSQLATQGQFTGTVGLGDPVVIDADNRNFTLRVNNQTSVAITLTDGSYTPEALVQEIQLQLNGNNALKAAERSVSVELDASNQLVFKTGDFGSNAKIDVTAVGANTAATLGLAVAEGAAGLDVVGTINGKAATGKGQVLTAGSGDDSSGISLRIGGGALGDRGAVTYIQGIGDRTVDLVNSFLSAKGVVSVRNEFYQKQLKEISAERVKLDLRVESLQKRLAAQFLAADSLVGQLKSTMTYLENQFSAMNGNNSKK